MAVSDAMCQGSRGLQAGSAASPGSGAGAGSTEDLVLSLIAPWKYCQEIKRHFCSQNIQKLPCRRDNKLFAAELVLLPCRYLGSLRFNSVLEHKIRYAFQSYQGKLTTVNLLFFSLGLSQLRTEIQGVFILFFFFNLNLFYFIFQNTYITSHYSWLE